MSLTVIRKELLLEIVGGYWEVVVFISLPHCTVRLIIWFLICNIHLSMSHLCEISLINGSFIYMELPLPQYFLGPIFTSIPFPKIIKGKLGCRYLGEHSIVCVGGASVHSTFLYFIESLTNFVNSFFASTCV